MKTSAMNVGYRLVRNATPTADRAPYTGMAIPVGSLAYDNILSKMIAAGTFLSRATAQFCLNAFYEYAAQEIAGNVVRINMGPVSIYPMIGGSFESEDDAYREPRNSLYVGATLSREIRDAVAGITPDYMGDESAAGQVKINSVFDLETMVPGVIAGTKDFRLCGIDLTVPDGEGESLALVTADGVTKVADIAVSETADGQRITCHLAATQAVPKGQYKVRLVSHGLDPTAPLTTVTKKVTLVEAVPEPEPEPAPELTRVSSTPGGTDGELSRAMSVYLAGSNLADPSAVAIDYTSVTGVESTRTLTEDEYEAEDAQILIPMSIWEDFAFDLGEPLTFKVTNAYGTAVRSATVSE